MASSLSHRRVLFAGVGPALAVLAAVTAVPTAASMASTQAASVHGERCPRRRSGSTSRRGTTPTTRPAA